MARTSITPRACTVNGSLDGVTGPTTIDATLVSNGAKVPAGYPAEELLIRVTNTHGSDHAVTIKAGDYPPALAQGQGDLAVTVTATTGVKYIGPLESGRFQQSDGSIEIDFASGHTGAIDVLRIKRA